MADGSPNLRRNGWLNRLRASMGLDVPKHLESGLLQLQYEQLCARAPFIYLAMATVAFAAASGDGGEFSWLYHVSLPGFFLMIGLPRSIVWYARRKRKQHLAAENLKKRLRNAAILAILSSMVGAYWTMEAYHATAEARQVIAPIFLFLVIFSAVICMINLPRIVIPTVIVGLSWPTLAMTASADTSIRSLGICFAIIAVVMIFLTLRQYSDSLANLQLRADLKKLAETDALTGLENRRAFEQKYCDIMQGNRTNPSVDLVMIDLDGFKKANDQYGHAAGDAILRQVSDRLQILCPDAVCISRIGGDEFVVMQNHLSDEEFGAEQDTAMRKALSLPYIYEGQPITIGASLGRATNARHGTDLQQLLNFADRRLYRAYSPLALFRLL
jgi:diguanylate cyclase